ncbi:MAG TPA: TetR/AcrR family transcriptional regulator [Streptosporangiaceae bacterium]|nr:TetR/AcrR family transcriptional regulator [Streptosporangiaceae bacterium]
MSADQDAGQLPTLPWHKPQRRRAGKEPLSRDRIVAAAIEILDADGLDAVSTRRVAEALQTGSASLYAHIANRDELVELMYDRIAAEIEVPEPDPIRWQEQLRTYARDAQRVWAAHADITSASLSAIPTGPNRLRLAERVLAILIAAGLPGRTAGLAVDRLHLYIDADAYEGWLHTARAKAGLSAEEYIGSIREYYRQLPADRFPLLAGLADTLMSGDSAERFEFGLGLLIDGLAVQLEREGPGNTLTKER